MKKLLAVLVGLSCIASFASAQEVEMIVHLKDGSEAKYNVDEIQWMRGTGIEYPWSRLVEIVLPYQSGISEPLKTLSFVRKVKTVFLGNMIVGGEHDPQDWRKIQAIRFNLLAEGKNIVALPRPADYGTAIMTDWYDSLIYGAEYRIFKYDLRGDSAAEELPNIDLLHFNIEVNAAGDRILYSGMDDWPDKLVERDLKTSERQILVDSSHITCARYFPGSNDIVYYTFGGREHGAGYYYFDRASGNTRLLVSHMVGSPETEIVNGFDISHDRKKLLIPGVQRGKNVILVEYDLETKVADTLLNYKPESEMKRSLWVQYSNDDSLILYSLSYFTLAPSPIGDQSEVGILDKSRRMKRIINVAPDNELAYCIPYPRWSPDNKSICYGAGSIPPNLFDSINPFYIYIMQLEP